MENLNHLKSFEYVRVGNLCMNLFWETLDEIREKYRKNTA